MELDTVSGLTVINYIINGLGEILPLSTTIDYNLYSVIEDLANNSQNSAIATVLTNAREKFNTLTENDEYLFDEDKNTKNEVLEINKLLNSIKICGNIDEELRRWISQTIKAQSWNFSLQTARHLFLNRQKSSKSWAAGTKLHAKKLCNTLQIQTSEQLLRHYNA